MVTFIVGVWVGIAVGYTMRALISERRMATHHDLSKSFERAQQKHIDQLKLMARSVRPVTKSKR